MESISNTAGVENALGRRIDTTFIVFFLALDFGQNLGVFALDTAFLAITLAAVATLPYFLADRTEISLGRWILGRMVIVGFGVTLGLLFKQSLGIFLPEQLSFLPMSLLIVTAVMTCYFQFYRFFKPRLSK